MQSNQQLSTRDVGTNTNDDDLDTTWEEELLRAVSLKVSDSEKKRPESNRLNRVKVCLGMKPKIKAQDKNGDTALHIAIKKNYQKIIECLLRYEAMPDISDHEGYTPMTDIPNREGYTPMTLPETLKNKEIQTLLKEHNNKLRSRADVNSSSRKSDATSMPDCNQEPSTSRGNDIGIQRNPDTVEDGCRSSEKEPYSTGHDDKVEKNPASFGLEEMYRAGDPIQRNWLGFLYHLRYLEFTVQRASNKEAHFSLAMEMSEAGQMDDVVLLYTNANDKRVGRFVQIKYSDEKGNEIFVDALFKDNGAYSVPKYFMTWRKVKENKSFSKIQVRNMILFTNIGLNLVDLTKEKILCYPAEEPDESFKIENTTCYKFTADKESNRKFYDRLKTGVVRQSANDLAKCVHNSKPETLKEDCSQDFHLSLVEHVFDAKTKNLDQNFINDDLLFRESFFSEYKRIAKISESSTSKQSETTKDLEVCKTWSEHKNVVAHVLPDDIDDEDISDFLEEFTLAANQPDLKKLGGIIANADQGLLHLRTTDQISIFQPKILEWFLVEGRKKKNIKYLSYEECKNFLDDMKSTINSLETSGMTALYCEEIKSYDIHFKSVIEEVNNLLTENRSNSPSRRIMKLVASSEETFLYSLWAYDTIQKISKYTKQNSFIYIHFGDLEVKAIMDQVKKTFKSPDHPDLLLVDCGSYSKELQDHTLWNSLVEIVKANLKKKVIIITRRSQKLDLAITQVRLEAKDEINFENLTDDSRQKLLGKRVTEFQGRRIDTISFAKLLGITDSDDKHSADELKETIDSDVLVELIRCKELKIGKQLPEIEKCYIDYIDRTFYQRLIIKKDILRDTERTDLLAISGVGIKAPDILEHVEKMSPTDQNITKYITLDNTREKEHFEDLCEKYKNTNIHWLEQKPGKYIWKRSEGDITYLFQYRYATDDESDYSNDMTGATNLEESHLADQSNPVIISDAAGMGKSVILNHLAQELKEKTPDMLVLKINLIHHAAALKDAKDKKNDLTIIERAIKFLVEKLLSDESNLARKVFQRIIMNVTKRSSQSDIEKQGGRSKVALFFDAFDEISTEYDDAVIDFLQTLTKNYLTKIVVTTRPCTSKTLEQKLNTFSYQIHPFSPDDQEYFLTKFWTAELSLEPVQKTEDRLKEYTQAIMRTLADSIQDYRNKLTGNPLQVNLVAKIFKSKIEGERRDFNSCQEFMNSDTHQPKMPERLDLIYLYREFVDQMFHRKEEGEERSRSAVPMAIENRKRGDRALIETHKKMALHALFGKDTAEKLLPGLEYDSDITEQRTGIITQFIDGQPHFGHETYAEYFAAMFFADSLKEGEPNQLVQEILVTKILLMKNYVNMRAFMNSLVPSKESNALKGESWEPYLVNSKNDLHENIFHVAAEEGNSRIMEMFLNRDRKDLIYAMCVFGITAMELAVEAGHLDELKLLVEHTNCELNTPFIKDNKNNNLSLLHAAAISGRLNIVRYLLEKGADIDARTYDGGSTPLYLAVVSSVASDTFKMQLKYYHMNKFPIISLPERLDVVKYLIDRGADVNQQLKSGVTVLHAATMLQKLWCSVDTGANSKHPNDATPVQKTRQEYQWKIVDYLIKHGADVNCQVKELDMITPLHIASMDGNLEVVKYLVENGARVDSKSHHECVTPLHMAAQEGQLESVKYLLKKNAKVDCPTNEGYAPLHIAVKRGRLKVVEYFLEMKVDINLELKPMLTPMFVAFLYGESDIVRELSKRGAGKLSEQQLSDIKSKRDQK